MRALILKFDEKLGFFAVFSYALVGSLSLGLSFLIFGILYSGLHINYKISVTVAYVLTVLFNFTANRHFTFKSTGSDLIKHGYRFLFMNFSNYLLTMLIVHIDVELLKLSPYFGLCASAAVTAMTGFLLSKFWVYTD